MGFIDEMETLDHWKTNQIWINDHEIVESYLAMQSGMIAFVQNETDMIECQKTNIAKAQEMYDRKHAKRWWFLPF